MIPNRSLLSSQARIVWDLVLETGAKTKTFFETVNFELGIASLNLIFNCSNQTSNVRMSQGIKLQSAKQKKAVHHGTASK